MKASCKKHELPWIGQRKEKSSTKTGRNQNSRNIWQLPHQQNRRRNHEIEAKNGKTARFHPEVVKIPAQELKIIFFIVTEKY